MKSPTKAQENMSPARTKTNNKLAMIPESPTNSPNRRLMKQNTDQSLEADYGDMTKKSGVNKKTKNTKKHARNHSQVFDS